MTTPDPKAVETATRGSCGGDCRYPACDGVIECRHFGNGIKRAITAYHTWLKESGKAVVDVDPNPMQILALGLLSGAGPQKRNQYIEVWRGLVAASQEDSGA